MNTTTLKIHHKSGDDAEFRGVDKATNKQTEQAKVTQKVQSSLTYMLTIMVCMMIVVGRVARFVRAETEVRKERTGLWLSRPKTIKKQGQVDRTKALRNN